jgi:hypothetical protein
MQESPNSQINIQRINLEHLYILTAKLIKS